MSQGASFSFSELSTIKDFKWSMAPYPVNAISKVRGLLYAGNWVMFDKLPFQAEAWELLKYIASPEATREQLKLEQAGRSNGVTQGGMPGRLSMMTEWAQNAATTTKQPLAAIQEICITGLDHQHIFPAIATSKWSEVYDVGMKPEMDKIMLNTTTVDAAVKNMDAKINEILASA